MDLKLPDFWNTTNLYWLIQVRDLPKLRTTTPPQEEPMLLRTTEPFRDLDRLAQQIWPAPPTGRPSCRWTPGARASAS